MAAPHRYGRIPARARRALGVTGLTRDEFAWQGVDRHGVTRLEVDDRADRLAGLQKVEGGVDLVMGHVVRDVGVHAEIAAQPLVDHAGQLAPAEDAAEGRAAPHPAGDELEGTGGDLLPGTGHADHGALAPALVAGLQGRAHQVDIAHGLEGVIQPAPGHLDQNVLDRLRHESFGLMHSVAPSALASGNLAVVDVDADDLARHRSSPRPGSPPCRPRPGQRPRRMAPFSTLAVLRTAPMPVGTAQPITDALDSGASGVDLGHRDLGQHGVFAERAGAHVVQDLLALVGEARGPVRHQPRALGLADGLAKVGLAGLDVGTVRVLGDVERDDMVAREPPRSRPCPPPRPRRSPHGRGCRGTAPPGPRRTG